MTLIFNSMKAKPLIAENDFEINPSNYSGSKIPRFFPSDGRYCNERGHMNYGVFRATEYVNRKAAPILDAIVTYFNSESQEERDTALETLKEVANQYKERLNPEP